MLQNAGSRITKPETRVAKTRGSLCKKRETRVAKTRDLIESRVVKTRISRCYNTRLASFFLLQRYSRVLKRNTHKTLTFATRDSLFL